MSSSHFEGLVGIHRHVEKIEGFLSEVRTVGIWGMGGIGKTTLARVVFHKLKEQFESFSMIENAREQLSRIGLEALGEKFLRELLKHQEIDTYRPSQVHICEEGLDNLPEELRILYWAEYPSSCVPLKFCAENLVNLKMPNSHLQQLWDGNQHFPNLKTIDLKNSTHLTKLPDLCQCPNIEEIDMDGCTKLSQIHSSSVLPKLLIIKVNHCKKLRFLNIGCNIIHGLASRLSALKAVYYFHDHINSSFNKVSVNVFISAPDGNISGFRYKVASSPLTEVTQHVGIIKSSKLKLFTDSMPSLLPFVSKIGWFDDNSSSNHSKFGNFKKDCYFLSHSGDHGVNYGQIKEEFNTPTMQKRRMSFDMPIRPQKPAEESSSLNTPLSISPYQMWDSEEEVEKRCINVNTNDGLMLRVPKSIIRWCLLTQVRLKKSDIFVGSEEGWSLESIAESNWIPFDPILDVLFSLDDQERAYSSCSSSGDAAKPFHILHSQLVGGLGPTQAYSAYTGFSIIFLLDFDFISILGYQRKVCLISASHFE
ncbi:disease resistance-like protein DSC1 [Senna tora]|uniref:Disease resistance-like protein DSC1 n=1 Tax=Senna tora TaxID=362788 RepID=A0A835CD16_9FABA|nr:disease resistance-like protein DSC1 [Senna tora]